MNKKLKEEIREKIETHYLSIAPNDAKEKMVPNEAELKKRFPLGQWSIESVEDLLDTNCFTIQMILPHVDYQYLLHVLYSCSEKLKQYIFYNMSDRYKKICKFDLAAESPTFEEQEKARDALVYVSTEVIAQLEEKAWQQLMLKLPKQPLPMDADLDKLKALNDREIKELIEKLDLETFIHAMALDDEWHTLWENKVKPLISKKALDLRESEMDSLLPQFPFQVEISRRLITYHAERI